MKNIEIISKIDRSKLSDEFYLDSLFETAYSCKMLSDNDAQKIQLSGLSLLASKTEEYTGGESSSVPVAIAQSIMKSIFYTISVYLKTFNSPDDAVRELNKSSISELYTHGKKLIDAKIKSAKYCYMLIRKNMLKTNNYTYNSTLISGISSFFKLYRPDFYAHEINITADYPLCNKIPNLVGIEFIQKYLESFKLENDFSVKFSEDTVHHLLCGLSNDYKDLIFNIFEQLLTSALGCILAKLPIRELSIDKAGLALLKALFVNKTGAEIKSMLQNAAIKMFDSLEITALSLQTYIMNALEGISENILSALIYNRLQDVFVKAAYPENSPRIYVSFGSKTDDENYRSIIDKIIKCKASSDKIAIIKQEIHSLADLEDLMLDAELDSNELTMIFNDLQPAEIAAFIKRHPYVAKDSVLELDEYEEAFRTCLHNYVNSMPKEKSDLIKKAVSFAITDDDEL